MAASAPLRSMAMSVMPRAFARNLSGSGIAACHRLSVPRVSPILRSRFFASESDEKKSDEKKSDSSDKRYEDTGEFDTQEHYKRVGNPISWANPTGGATLEDNSSNKLRWVYPFGVAGILLLCLWSRRRNLIKEQEEAMIGAPEISMPDTSSFRTSAYRPPPPPPASGLYGDEDEGRSSDSFSPPPRSPSW
eukprot:TRINITY_DN69191_c0_g1_i1.p1 TRINITY_DN69191_c0_g1~~TRINITY_DN69191_c0_g1_i1.p1  ORF type:complete len:209 (-),score=32.33 TRINITY_DN69191_c0_g1_i1:62-634(-)